MIYVIRHGQTDWNLKKVIMGSKDIPLNEEGIRQANATKELLNGVDIDLIITSPLLRARQTTEIINDKNVEVIVDPRIRERCLGDLEGKDYSNYPDDIWDINVNTSEHNVETMEEFKARIFEFIEEVLDKYKDRNILISAHGGVSALLNAYFNDTLYTEPITDKFVANCSVAVYDSKGRGVSR